MVDLDGRKGFRRTLFALISIAVVTRIVGGVSGGPTKRSNNIDARVVTFRLFHFCAQFFNLAIGATPHASVTAFHSLQKREYVCPLPLSDPLSAPLSLLLSDQRCV